MNTDREYRQLMIDRQLDAKRLEAALSEVISEMAKDQAPDAGPVRLESVLLEPSRTTVYVSGNGAGLDALTSAVGSRYPETKTSAASREDARRVPESPGSQQAD